MTYGQQVRAEMGTVSTDTLRLMISGTRMAVAATPQKDMNAEQVRVNVIFAIYIAAGRAELSRRA